MASSTTEVLFSLMQQYFQMGAENLKRLQEINTEIQQEKYTLSKLLKDGVAAWSNAVSSVLIPMQLAAPSQAGVPNLLFMLGARDTDPLTPRTAIALQGKAATASDLIQVGGTGKIKSDRVQPTLDSEGLTVNFTRVSMDDQNAPARPASGLYVGVILVDSKPAATIQLFVE